MKKICKSSISSVLIGLGVYALLVSNYSYFSMILFALGLYTICLFKFDLFTGKCGYSFATHLNISIKEVLKILIINLVIGYILGIIFSFSSTSIEVNAIKIVNAWTFSIGYFIRAVMCGVIMFIAVHMFSDKSSPVGIFFGIPLFILCGFQHCIANVIIMGCAHTVSYSLLLAILGNWLGAVLMQKLIETTDE